MMDTIRIEDEMKELKQLLENLAERYEYDFCHPDVLEVSQRLDQIIIRLLTVGCHPES
jgi:hypothetical protein